MGSGTSPLLLYPVSPAHADDITAAVPCPETGEGLRVSSTSPQKGKASFLGFLPGRGLGWVVKNNYVSHISQLPPSVICKAGGAGLISSIIQGGKLRLGDVQ